MCDAITEQFTYNTVALVVATRELHLAPIVIFQNIFDSIFSVLIRQSASEYLLLTTQFSAEFSPQTQSISARALFSTISAAIECSQSAIILVSRSENTLNYRFMRNANSFRFAHWEPSNLWMKPRNGLSWRIYFFDRRHCDTRTPLKRANSERADYFLLQCLLFSRNSVKCLNLCSFIPIQLKSVLVTTLAPCAPKCILYFSSCSLLFQRKISSRVNTSCDLNGNSLQAFSNRKLIK